MSKNPIFKIRKIFDPSEDPGIAFEELDAKGELRQAIGRTVQSFKDDCDINKIMEKYATTGALPDLIKQNPQYGDFASAPDYQTALNLVNHAHEQFENLEAHIRERFNNDPSKFLAFCADPNSFDEMVKMGLAIAQEAPESKSELPAVKRPKGGKTPVGDAPSGEGPDA